jgi:hypothetical protein
MGAEAGRREYIRSIASCSATTCPRRTLGHALWWWSRRFLGFRCDLTSLFLVRKAKFSIAVESLTARESRVCLVNLKRLTGSITWIGSNRTIVFRKMKGEKAG